MSPTNWRSSAGGIGPSRILTNSAGTNPLLLPAKTQGVHMSRFRRILQRFIKPAAMVGTVGVLSLSLIVTTPSNAYAFKEKFPVTPTFIMGATKTVAPVAMAVVSVTPVGWGLRVLQLGMLAYSYSDMWMPFVTGTFGQPDADQDQPPGTAGILPGLRMTGLTVSGTNNRSMSIGWNYTPQVSTSKTAVIHTDAQCQQITDVAGKPAGSIWVMPFDWSFGVSGSTTSGTLSTTNMCSTTSKMLGVTAAAKTGTQNYNGPENILRWGTDLTAGSFDPRGNDVGYQGQSECIDSAGTISWVTGPEIPGDNGAMLMPSCEKAGKGHGTGRTKVTAFKPDGTQETVWDTGAQPLSDPATPLCDPGRATSGCVMEILKDDKPCAPGDVECENWQEESGKDPTRWKCKFGPYTLPLSSCNLLARAYSPNGAPVNDENTDNNPQTNSNAGPDGNPAPAPAPAVSGTTTGTAPAPGGSGQTSPSADEKSRQCFPTGWAAFNPVEWVLKPVRCAFEPSKDTSSMQQIFRDKLQQRAPVSWITAASSLEGPAGGGCPNWVVEIPGGFSQNVVCGSSYIQALVGIRLPLFGLLATAMVWPLVRSLWYAAIPILRVTPSGGK